MSPEVRMLVEAAQRLVDAIGQTEDGEWVIRGDGEILASDLSDALSGLDERRSEGLPALVGEGVGDDTALPPTITGEALAAAALLTLDSVVEHGYGTADCHLILHHDAYHALERALAAYRGPEGGSQ